MLNWLGVKVFVVRLAGTDGGAVSNWMVAADVDRDRRLPALSYEYDSLEPSEYAALVRRFRES